MRSRPDTCRLCFARLEDDTCVECGATFTSDRCYQVIRGDKLKRLSTAYRRKKYRERVVKLSLQLFPGHSGTWERSIQHDVTIQRGFNREIRASLIGSRANCRIISRAENVAIGTRITERGKANERKWDGEED